MRSYLWQFNPARYKRAFLMGKVTEKHVVKDIRDGMTRFGLNLDFVDAGSAGIRGLLMGALCQAGIDDKQARAVLSNLKNVPAASVGHSDLVGVLAPDGRGIYIEVKRPAWLDPVTMAVMQRPGVPSQVQLEFLDEKALHGAIVGVAWSFDDAMEIIGKERLITHYKSIKKRL